MDPEEQATALRAGARALWETLRHRLGASVNIGQMIPSPFQDGFNGSVVEVAKISRSLSRNASNLRGLTINIGVENTFDGRPVFCTRFDSSDNALIDYVIESIPTSIYPRDCDNEYLPPPNNIYFNLQFVRGFEQNPYIRYNDEDGGDGEPNSGYAMYNQVDQAFDVTGSANFVSNVLLSLPEFDSFRYPDPTTMRMMINARRGQGEFRRQLDIIWGGKCAVLGITARELLRASHVKPWKDSDDVERLDANNGILLSVHLDALFDEFLISFDESGLMIVSNRINKDTHEVLKISGSLPKEKITRELRQYLRYHRQRMDELEARFQDQS